METLCLAYDIGGTKVAVGLVTKAGKVLDERKLHFDLELHSQLSERHWCWRLQY